MNAVSCSSSAFCVADGYFVRSPSERGPTSSTQEASRTAHFSRALEGPGRQLGAPPASLTEMSSIASTEVASFQLGCLPPLQRVSDLLADEPLQRQLPRPIE
jgi:hypothetical protein